MRKISLLIPILLFAHSLNAQEITFKDARYPNGLLYPIATIKENPEAQKALNEKILSIVSEYESQDYCIGQYGFVQQTSFIQLHFYFNCIDMDESKNAYYLFDLGDGQLCAPSKLFLDKQKENVQRYFRSRVSDFYLKNGKEPLPTETLNQLIIDQFTVQLSEEGLLIRSTTLENWGTQDLVITWLDLRPYLKTTFI
jgi:uncharacterized protein with GYD domain